MKKAVLSLALLTVLLCACNRKDFVNKLTGTWKINKYYAITNNNKADQTASFDTTHAKYQFVFNGDNTYTNSYTSYQFRADSIYHNFDSIYDSTTMVWNYKIDTLRFVDTTVTPVASAGKWFLLNSEEDLELIDNADTGNATIFRILSLTKNDLNLLNGNQEYDLTK